MVSFTAAQQERCGQQPAWNADSNLTERILHMATAGREKLQRLIECETRCREKKNPPEKPDGCQERRPGHD